MEGHVCILNCWTISTLATPSLVFHWQPRQRHCRQPAPGAGVSVTTGNEGAKIDNFKALGHDLTEVKFYQGLRTFLNFTLKYKICGSHAPSSFLIGQDSACTCS